MNEEGQTTQVADVMARVSHAVSERPWVRITIAKFIGAIMAQRTLLKAITDPKLHARALRRLEMLRTQVYYGYLKPITEGQWWTVRTKVQAAHLFLASVKPEIAEVLPDSDDVRAATAVRLAIDVQLQDIYNRAVVRAAFVQPPGGEPPDQLPKPDVAKPGVEDIVIGEPGGGRPSKGALQVFDRRHEVSADQMTMQVLANTYTQLYDLKPDDINEDPPSPAAHH